MTDIEDIDDREDNNLEAILEAWGTKEYENAENSGDPKKYLREAIYDVMRTFKLPHAAYHNILDFQAKRCVYHRNHKAKDIRMEVLTDTYQYLLELKNEFDIVDSNLPELHRHWR